MKNSLFYKKVYLALLWALPVFFAMYSSAEELLLKEYIPLKNEDKTMPTDIVIKGIRHDIGGTLVFMVFTKNGFPKDHSQAIFRYEVLPAGEEEIIQVELPKGEFALKVHHDKNSDGKVSKNWTRIMPSEGLAFSNGARIRFGPPSFKSAKLLNNNIGTIVLKMNYP